MKDSVRSLTLIFNFEKKHMKKTEGRINRKIYNIKDEDNSISTLNDKI